MSNNIVENDDTQQQQNNMMIILYYCYPPSPIPQTQLEQHSNFQKTICTNLNLGGRIRVSEEGINGVLSGTETNLRKYEVQLRLELIKLVGDDSTTNSTDIHNGDDNDDKNESITTKAEVDPTKEWLDMKYCHLRKEIPTSQQLFNTLNVKITREVVSLIEPPKQVGKSSRGRARCKQRRKQKRREKERLEKLLQEECIVQEIVMNHGEEKVVCDSTRTANDTANDTSIQQQTENAQDVHQSKASDSAPSLPNQQEVGTAISIKDWEKTTPAVHLSPQQWNEKLLQLSQEKNINEHANEANAPSEHDDTTQEQVHTTIPKDAILLDTRNMYETKIGHFAVPNLETFFPNTRKFSSLPQALNTKEAAEALAGKEVYMYCTGGVRCERAGSYLRALSESNSGAWQGKEQPKGIYQLQGGIQKYLESYGREEQEVANEEGEDDADNQTAEKKCLYRGKNFVFDPRRTDPIIGNGITESEAAGSSSDTKCIVGKCIICSCPHDDYDNGHAPCEEKEARCCRCRVLVLVCNDCRKKVYSWGEEAKSCIDNGEGEIVKTELFCGKGGVECIDEGNVADQVETSQF